MMKGTALTKKIYGVLGFCPYLYMDTLGMSTLNRKEVTSDIVID